MKVLEKGRPKKKWSAEIRCVGTEEGCSFENGCGALLLVEQDDLYLTPDSIAQCGVATTTISSCRFMCPECHKEIRLDFEVPIIVVQSMPSRDEWMFRNAVSCSPPQK